MTTFTEKAVRYIPRLMTDLQIDRIQACGIFGNIGGETGGFMALQEIKPTVKGSRGGYGWLQWTGPRRKKYEAWCVANKLSPAEDESNYRYLVYETTTDEIHSLIQLRKTTTLVAATETFMSQNLRPGVKNLQGRVDWAQKAYDVTASEAKTNKQTTTAIVVGGLATGTGAVIVSNPTITTHPHHTWLWIWLAGLVVVGAIWGVIHHYHKTEAQQATKGIK